MSNESIKVNCSFCGKEIECPENMKNAEKHSCFECFQDMEGKLSDEEIQNIHVDIPTAEFKKMLPDVLTNSLVEEVFPNIWKDGKEELKEMSRRKLAEEMFGTGAYIAIKSMMEQLKKNGRRRKENY